MAILDLDKTVSGSKFAELIGVSRQAVSAMLKEGILSRGDSAGEWLASYIGHLREIAAGRADTPAAQHSRERILHAEATRREELARMATFRRQEQAGQLIEADGLTAIMSAVCFIAKNDIWSWQGRLPPLLEQRTRAEIGEILAREAWDTLNDMHEKSGAKVQKLALWVQENAPEKFWQHGRPAIDKRIGES